MALAYFFETPVTIVAFFELGYGDDANRFDVHENKAMEYSTLCFYFWGAF